MEQQRQEVKLTGVYMHQEEGKVPQHFVLLRDETARRMPIWIGQFEAWAISFAIEENPPERPMTHDIIVMLMESTGATFIDAAITDLRDESFYGSLSLRLLTGEEKTLDVRPSDAIAVALRAKCPIYVAEHVLAIAAKAA